MSEKIEKIFASAIKVDVSREPELRPSNINLPP
jgi:hypothetical protein